MRYMKFFKFIVVFLLFVSVAKAGWIEKKDGKTIIHLKLWELPEPGKTDTYTRAEVAVVKKFVKKFPEIFKKEYAEKYKKNPKKYGKYNWDNVEIQLEKFSGIKVEGVETALLAIAGGVSPDVMYVNFRQSSSYIGQGFLYPLDEYFAQLSEEEKKFRVHPKIWPVIRRKGKDGKEHIWAIPYGAAIGKIVIYRKDLFDEKDIPYPDNNWTWNDMYEIAKKLTDPAKGKYGIMFGKGKHESWYWITFLWSAGGEVMVYDKKTDTWRAAFGTKEAAEALDYYTRICTDVWHDESGMKRYGYAYKEGEGGLKWNRGEIAMKTAYVDDKLLENLNPDIMGIVPVPLGPTGKRGGELNSRMMGMFSGIKDPVIRDAAWEYMRYYHSKEAVKEKVKIYVEGGMGKFVYPSYLKEFGYEDFYRLIPKQWIECFDISMKTGKPEPYGKNSNVAYDLMTYPIKEADELAIHGDLPEDKEERLAVLLGLLQKSVRRAEIEMLGNISPTERMWRRITAVIALIAITIMFTFVFRKIFKAFTPPPTPGVERKDSWGFIRYKWAYVILLPAALTIFFWRYLPLARGSVMAFQDYNLMGNSTWVWLDNFGEVLWDVKWWEAVWNTVRFSFLIVALTFLPPVILAVFLQESPVLNIFFRTVFYLPAVITSLVVIVLWKQFYEPSELGVLNMVLMHIPAIVFIGLGVLLLFIMFCFFRRLMIHQRPWIAICFLIVGFILLYSCCSFAKPVLTMKDVAWYIRPFKCLPEPFRWLDDSETAMLACVIPMIWAGMGPGCLIYLAALKGISNDFYEAADIDGASFIDKIMFIVFPTLKPLLIINFVGVFIRSCYGSTQTILAMTGGGANTEVAGLKIFYKAFVYMQFGPATAMAWILGFLMIGFTMYQLRILAKVEFKATGNKV
jgi:multiple sugar transport system permease protein